MAPCLVVDVDETVAEMRNNPANIRFADLCKVAVHYFGDPRKSNGGSHRIWRMPWPGDPRVVLQDDKGKAKAYQVRQVLDAVDKMIALEAKPAAEKPETAPVAPSKPKKNKKRKKG